MSKGYSGLFTNTSGTSVNNSRDTSITKPHESYTVTDELKNHIENAQPSESGKAGIKGAHNKENFSNEIKRIGATITDTKPNSQIDGIEKISYKMPKKDKFGKPTGEYQSSTHEKTVYDPKKISTDAYLKRGLEAANNAARISSTGKLIREWTGVDNQGVRWHGYCDNSGKITSFFPED